MTEAVAKIESLLSEMLPAERAQILQSIVRQLGDVFPCIVTSPGICDGDPCIVRTRIRVRTLEEYRRRGATDADILSAFPSLRAEDLADAWAFVRAHPYEIERQMRETANI